MFIKDMKDCLTLCYLSRITPFIWGHAGIGKSMNVDEFARYLGGRSEDVRCSQMEGADLRGLPKDKIIKEVDRTIYAIPDFLPTDTEDIVILFLDELNRAEADVLQAAFQLIHDRKIGKYVLPKHCFVVIAGNYADGAYHVSNFTEDEAFIDRCCHLELVVDDNYRISWAEYMQAQQAVRLASVYGYSAQPTKEQLNKIIHFTNYDPLNFLGDVKGDLGFTRKPTPRSWDVVMRIEAVYAAGKPVMKDGKPVMENGRVKTVPFSESAYRDVITGMVGLTAATGYFAFQIRVSPDDILNDGLKKHRRDVDTLKREHLLGLMHGLIARAKDIKPSSNEGQNLVDFLGFMVKHKERDLAISMVKNIIGIKVGKVPAGVMAVNKKLADLISEFQDDQDSWLPALTKNKALQDLIAEASQGKK